MQFLHNSSLLDYAKTLRRNMTPQEQKLWNLFLKKRPEKWYKQRPISQYIVDFYCASARLAIEIDGSQHYLPEGMQYDSNRTNVLQEMGIHVMRFTNADVDVRFKAVCEQIDRYIHNANNSGGRE